MKPPRQCPSCGAQPVRNDRHDAYYCPKCDAWLESVCGDPRCEACRYRPEKPSQAFLAEVAAGYEAIRKDPAAWSEEQSERAVWGRATSDGLDDE